MSYLPVIVNATAFVMYMTAPLARRIGIDYSKLTNSSLVAALGYEGMAWLGSKFISKSLSENPYYKAVCFFACFVGHYGAAKLLEWRAVKSEMPPHKNPQYSSAQNIVETKEGSDLELAMKAIQQWLNLSNNILKHRELITKHPEFVSHVNQKGITESVINDVYLSIENLLNEYEGVFDSYKALVEKAQQKELKSLSSEDAALEGKMGALVSSIKAFNKMPAFEALQSHTYSILESIHVQIDTSKASIVECHESIMKVIDKNKYRKGEIAIFQGEAKDLRAKCGPGLYIEEGLMDNLPPQMMGMGWMINQMRSYMGPVRNLNSCFVDLEKTWEELSKIQEQYNSFLLGLGQVNELEQPVNITGLKEAQNEFIKRTAALASKVDGEYIGLKAKLERLNKEGVEAQQAQQRGGVGIGVGGNDYEDVD